MKGDLVEEAGSPFEVIAPGVTAVLVIVLSWQQRRVVLVILVSGVFGTSVPDKEFAPTTILKLDIRPLKQSVL